MRPNASTVGGRRTAESDREAKKRRFRSAEELTEVCAAQVQERPNGTSSFGNRGFDEKRERAGDELGGGFSEECARELAETMEGGDYFLRRRGRRRRRGG